MDDPTNPPSSQYVCPACPCTSDAHRFEQPGNCPTCKMKLVQESKIRNVAIVVWPGVELLDFAGPGEVFSVSQAKDGRQFRVYTVSKTKQPITSQGFLTVTPQYSIQDCPPPDIIVLPGGGTGHVTGDADFLKWIKRTSHDAEVTLSVCTGAFVLGEIGRLEGLKATTWHGAIEALRKNFPKTEVVDDQRFVDQGKVITSAGVSAGIDSSLYLVARLLGEETAWRTARYMEYDWRPSETPQVKNR